MSEWPFEGLGMFGYDAILADPPWDFRVYSEKGDRKSPSSQYDTMSVEDICLLPVGQLASRHCALFMWTTFPVLDRSFEVLKAWGFRYATGGAWHKKSSTGEKTNFGTGYIHRSASEIWLVGVTGQPTWRSRSVRNLIEAPVRGHSRKPDQMYENIEDLISGPKVELFARQKRSGWDSWGNETDKFTAP